MRVDIEKISGLQSVSLVIGINQTEKGSESIWQDRIEEGVV
jgi:hypothetical protein